MERKGEGKALKMERTYSQSRVHSPLHHIRTRYMQDGVGPVFKLRQTRQVESPVLRRASRSPCYADR